MRASVALDNERLAWADAVVVVTDHQVIDYQHVLDQASLVVDTRNVMAGRTPGRARVVPLASGSRPVTAAS
jgi:UDP-N-acetyl-D-glucosamine dehydrogenase